MYTEMLRVDVGCFLGFHKSWCFGVVSCRSSIAVSGSLNRW